MTRKIQPIRGRSPYNWAYTPGAINGRRLPRRLSNRVAYMTGFRDGAQHTIEKLQNIGALPKW